MADKENRQIKARTFEEQPKRTSEKIKAPVKETENKGSRKIGASAASGEKKASGRVPAPGSTRRITPPKSSEQGSESKRRSYTILPASAERKNEEKTEKKSLAASKGSKKLSGDKNRTGASTGTGNVKETTEVKGIWKRTGYRFLTTMLSLAISLVVIYFLGIKIFNHVVKHYVEPKDANSTEQISIVIDKNDSLKTISKKLEEAGIINNATVFKYYVDFSDMSSKLLAGKFTLSPSMTYDEIINQLKRKSAAKTSTKVLITEGTLLKEMEDKFLSEDVLKSGAEFEDKITTGEDYSKYWFIQEVLDKEKASTKHRIYALEGYMFPDTYDFYIYGSADGIITRMLDRFKQIYTDEYKKRAEELGMTTDDVIILASIIEKEGGNLEDFKKISGVFHNRLYHSDATGHKLQSDATHQYFMPEKKFSWTTEELQIDSPYNTYMYPGLPIGPICNPGKAAIEAALWPDEDVIKEGYLYFVAADLSKGEILYAKTYEEHLKNVEYARQFWPDN